MEVVLLIALVALMIVFAARAATDRREPARVPVVISRRRVTRRR